MIPFILLGGGLYLVFDALSNERKSFDPLDYGLPTKGFRGYRKGAAHFAKGGITPKFKVLESVRDIKGNYGFASGTISSVIPPYSSDGEFQYEVMFDGEREEHSLMESELVSEEPQASMVRRDRYGFFGKGGETKELKAVLDDLNKEVLKSGTTFRGQKINLGRSDQNKIEADIQHWGDWENSGIYPYSRELSKSYTKRLNQIIDKLHDRYPKTYISWEIGEKDTIYFAIEHKKFAKGGEVPEVGQRVELIQMYDDPKPVEPRTKGTVRHVGGDVINVDWDNGRSLGLVMGVDKFKMID